MIYGNGASKQSINLGVRYVMNTKFHFNGFSNDIKLSMIKAMSPNSSLIKIIFLSNNNAVIRNKILSGFNDNNNSKL